MTREEMLEKLDLILHVTDNQNSRNSVVALAEILRAMLAPKTVCSHFPDGLQAPHKCGVCDEPTEPITLERDGIEVRLFSVWLSLSDRNYQMCLSREQAARLAPVLARYAETGQIA